MKLPSDVSGADLVAALAGEGYGVVRQSGSHVRLTRSTPGAEHHVTVPLHDPLKRGTLSGILKDVADHLGLTRDELLARLDL